MPSEKKIRKKLDKYIKRLQQLQRQRDRSQSRSRSRSPIASTIASPIEDVTSVQPEAEMEYTIDNENTECVLALEEALGVEYDQNNQPGENLQPQITSRFNHILLNGLPKDEKDEIFKKYKIPENCTLLEAPLLNEEVKSILTENAKNRDKALEFVQHQLGIATAAIGQVMTQIIKNEMEGHTISNIQLIKGLTDASKLLNDIHHNNTKTRRMLISPLLDKTFNTLIEKTKRDEHLYGVDLASKIKTSQELKKSSLQIKKAVPKPTTPKTNPKMKMAGNKFGPPQASQTRVAAPRGGPKSRAPQPPQSHRPAPRHPRPERAAPRGSHYRR